MPQKSLKDKLINKIKGTNNLSILEEVANLFELYEPGTIYHVNEKQRAAIEDAKTEIYNKQTLNNEQANKETDKWLNT